MYNELSSYVERNNLHIMLEKRGMLFLLFFTAIDFIFDTVDREEHTFGIFYDPKWNNSELSDVVNKWLR